MRPHGQASPLPLGDLSMAHATCGYGSVGPQLMSALRQCEHCGSVEKVHDRDSCDYLRSKLSADEVESLLDVLPYSSIPTTWYVATAVRWFLDHGWNQPIRDAAASEGN